MKNENFHYDVIICGAGIIGLTLCRELLKRTCGTILILEKEPEPARHASGRNSGVLHAGIYYAPDTMKAAYCLEGNRLMKEYCRSNKLPLSEKGKVIVTRNEKEEETLEELHRRALENNTPVRLIDRHELQEIEPKAKTFSRALYSPETAVCSPKKIMTRLAEELQQNKNVTIQFNTVCTGFKSSREIMTNRGNYTCRYFINAAGAFSDRIAHARRLGKDYRLVPFKGTYFQLRDESAGSVRGNIYPVPDIRNPFLGVHFTRGTGGKFLSALPRYQPSEEKITVSWKGLALKP